MEKVLKFKQISQFTEDSSLRSITVGLISNEGINVVVLFIFGKDISKYSLKLKDKIKSLPSQTSVTLGSNSDASVDSYLLPNVLMATQRLQRQRTTHINVIWEIEYLQD